MRLRSSRGSSRDREGIAAVSMERRCSTDNEQPECTADPECFMKGVYLVSKLLVSLEASELANNLQVSSSKPDSNSLASCAIS
jgi:hypothetical protein